MTSPEGFTRTLQSAGDGQEGRPESPIVAPPWDSIPKGKRFGRQLTPDAVPLLKAGTLLRFYSSDPWFEPGEHMPSNGEIVVFTGRVSDDFPKVGAHLEVSTLDGAVYPGGGWVFRLFQFVSDPSGRLGSGANTTEDGPVRDAPISCPPSYQGEKP